VLGDLKTSVNVAMGANPFPNKPIPN